VGGAGRQLATAGRGAQPDAHTWLSGELLPSGRHRVLPLAGFQLLPDLADVPLDVEVANILQAGAVYRLEAQPPPFLIRRAEDVHALGDDVVAAVRGLLREWQELRISEEGATARAHGIRADEPFVTNFRPRGVVVYRKQDGSLHKVRLVTDSTSSGVNGCTVVLHMYLPVAERILALLRRGGGHAVDGF